MKIIFLGSDNISLHFLKNINEPSHSTQGLGEEIVAIFTQPDKPKGRDKKISQTPVKLYALEKNIPVYENFINVKELNSDLGISVSYGKIIPKDVYLSPKFGTINVHFSLLPKYRGPAPLQWAIMNGEKETGVSIFQINEILDGGDILLQESFLIDEKDDIYTLEKKSMDVGLKMLDKVLLMYKKGEVVKKPQTGEPSITRLLTKSDGRINWADSIERIYNKVRALKKWPSSYCFLKNKMLKLIDVEIYPPPSCRDGVYKNDISNAVPGTIVQVIKQKGFIVKTGDGYLLIKTVKLEGKNEISAWEFWKGARIEIGDVLL